MELANKNNRICYLVIFLKNYFGSCNLNFSIDKDSDNTVIALNLNASKLLYIKANEEDDQYFISFSQDESITLELVDTTELERIDFEKLIHVISKYFEIEKTISKDSTLHILNGDALLGQFPSNIKGEKIIMRESLVNGNVEGISLEEILNNRSAFILNEGWISQLSDYYKITAIELVKLLNISSTAEIYLWFEEDLFCQVNMWFIGKILFSMNTTNTIKFVRPLSHAPYSFAHHSQEQMDLIYKQAILIKDLSIFDKLWSCYLRNNSTEFLELKHSLPESLRFISKAIDAQNYRSEIGKNGLDNLTSDIKSIAEEPDTLSFGIAYQKFCKKYPYYGFGDLQFKRIYDRVKQL